MVEAFRIGTDECDTAPGYTCTTYNVRGRNLPPNTNAAVRCQWSNAGGPWSDNHPSNGVRTNGSGSFTGTSTCEVGVNTRLRYEVQFPGQSYTTDPVTR